VEALRKRSRQLKLNQKITLFVISCLVIPIIIFYVIILQNIEQSSVDNRMKELKASMVQSQNTIQKNVEMCNMSTKVFLNSKNLMDYISQVKEESVPIQQNLEFYKNDIGNLEKIVNSNPYLHQIRIYVDSPSVLEMVPILYSYDRLKRLSWYGNGEIESGSWQFDYSDTIFPTYISEYHLVSLVTEISNYHQGTLGIIEVATRMDLMFPDIYTSDENQWTCFIDDKGHYYYDTDVKAEWLQEPVKLLDGIKIDKNKPHYDRVQIDGEDVLIAYQPIKELNGHLLKIVSLKNDTQYLKRLEGIYLGVLVIGLFILTFFIDYIVKIILRRFYCIMETIHQVKEGDLQVQVPPCGGDEIGELGNQINEMLSRISDLMEEGIRGERLVKDSEIRALQNQINAHFIYNVLESIKMMAEINEEYDISDALTSLGKLLRYSMKWVSHNVVISEEIEYIKNYLALINLRFDYNIILSINLQEEILIQEIPKMSLQPIVENAICHGIEDLAEDTTIYIKSYRNVEFCFIEITDSGKGMSEEQVTKLRKKIAGEIETSGAAGNGLGLKNVQDRIQISFGKSCGINVISKEGCYTKVIVKIPYKDKVGEKR